MAVLRPACFPRGELDDIPGTDSVVATDNDFLGLDYGAESGAWFVVGAASTTAPSHLSQMFSDIVGQQLTVSGWAIGDKTRPNGLGEITYFFDNQQLGAPAVTGTWTQSTFHATATGLDTLTIEFGDDGSFIGLDNFSVSSGGLSSSRDVPELSTWAMSLFGFAGLGSLARTGRGLRRASLRRSAVELAPDCSAGAFSPPPGPYSSVGRLTPNQTEARRKTVFALS